MSTKDNALIEKMARAICLAGGRDPDLEDNNVADGVFLPNWTMFNSGAKDALSVARKAILEEAAQACVKRGIDWAKDEFHEDKLTAQRARTSYAEADRCAAAIRSLSTQEQNND